MVKLSIIVQCDRWRSGQSLRGTLARLQHIVQVVVSFMVPFYVSKGAFQSISWSHFEHCSNTFHIFQKHLPVFVQDGTERKLSPHLDPAIAIYKQMEHPDSSSVCAALKDTG